MDHSNNNWRDGLARIQLCVSEIREWMNQNMLKLNDDKTELIVFTSKYKQDLYNDLSITIGDTVVDCSSQVKDLGVIFDRVLSLRQHVSYTSKTCRFHLRNISRIRKYIPQDTSVILVKSLVMSRLDYSNGLFYGLPTPQMHCFWWFASGSKLCCTHCNSGKAPRGIANDSLVIIPQTMSHRSFYYRETHCYMSR